jgi:hypothetical protein
MIAGKTREQQYRNIEKDSSSSIKVFSQDRKKYNKIYILGEKVKESEDSKASIVGKLVETQLYEPEQFDKRFHISSLVSTPTGNMLAFVEGLYKHSRDNTNEEGVVSLEFEEIAKLAHEDSGFKWTLERVLGNFIGSDAEIYYKEIREVRSRNLTVVTLDDIGNADRIVEELKNNTITSGIVNLVNSDRYQVLKQEQVEDFVIDGLALKAMMDQVVIDHKEKTVQVYDLKCTWNVENFYEDYYLYRRAYIQAYVYKKAAEALKNQLDLNDYRIEDPKFIVCDSINYYSPLIYTTSDVNMTDAYYGFTYKGRDYPGVTNIIKDLIWAKENDVWNISRENHENKGIVRLT